MRVLGIYRERQFSPGKVEADAAILDAVLDELRGLGFEASAVEPAALGAWPGPAVDLVLAMCQGGEPLRQLSALEQFGAVAINSALAIRNCYRDLLNPGLARAGVPIPAGMLVGTGTPLHAGSMLGLEISLPLYVKRGDLHALGSDDVQRVETLDQLRRALRSFAERGVGQAYVQQEIEGRLVKFYGVSGGEYFTALADGEELPDAVRRAIAIAASTAASAIGLEAWGGDAVVGENGSFRIIDFNDWPSFSRVRAQAARAIARRATWLLQRARLNASRAGLP
jgi:glutathione synthase/RimK-type ligase-like ATP-grasp enzyme